MCTVDGDGTVAGVAAGSCTVQIVWSGNENYAPTSPQNLVAALPIVATSNEPAAALTQNAYGATYDLTVGGTPLAIAIAPTPGTGQAGAAQYRSGTPKVCSVDLSTGAVTGLAARECRIQVRFVGSATVAATDWSGDYTLMVGKGEVPHFDDPYGIQLAIGSRVKLQVDLSPYGRVTFSMGSLSPCTVDRDGTVTPTEDALFEQQCIILAAFDANDNYQGKDEAIFATVDLMHGTQVVTFDEPYGSDPTLRVGETLPLVVGSEPVSDQGGRISYGSADTAVCTVDSATGEITAVAPGTCGVRTRAAAVSNYNATGQIELATIEVEEGVLPLAWTPQRWGQVGTNLALTAVDTGSLSGVTVTYSVEDAGDTGCTLSGIRTLAFTGTGVCMVTATASKTHYEDWGREHVIRVRPTAITVTPEPFTAGATLQVGGDTKIPAAPSLTPSDATASWQLVRGERDCELVSAQTGEVRAKAVPFEGDIIPQCFLQVVASKPNHETVVSVPVSIALALGTIGDVDIRYGSGVNNLLRTGGTAEMTPPPEDGDGVGHIHQKHCFAYGLGRLRG